MNSLSFSVASNENGLNLSLFSRLLIFSEIFIPVLI